MNAWFDRLRTSLADELGPDAAQSLGLSPDEARALLGLAREVAHGSGARQYAPLVTYLAGRLAQAHGGASADLIAAVARAAQAAGPAGEEGQGL